jgi:hypothetical protein
MLSVHTDCPGTEANQIICKDDTNATNGDLDSRVALFVQQRPRYQVRVSGFSLNSGFYALTLGDCSPCFPGNADKIAPGTVNFADVTSVLANFGFVYAVSGEGDADCNGTVNFADVTEVLSNFNSTCS